MDPTIATERLDLPPLNAEAIEALIEADVDTIAGEVVNVATGYARNFLLPRRLAEQATPAKVAELRKREEQRARHEARTFEQAQEIARTLEQTVLRFDVKAGATGSLFGSVTATDIADELWRTRKVRVDRRKIALAEPIKRIGRYSVPIDVFTDVTVEVKTLVAPEGGELPPEEELAAMAAAETDAAEREPALAATAAQDFVPAADAELVETPEMHAEERPDDEFDRVVDAALETPPQ